MVKIGLDISQNSTGICINNDNNIEFISFMNATKLSKLQEELVSYIDIQLYDKTKSTDSHTDTQKNNLVDYIKLSERIVDYISLKLVNVPENEIIFSFEDFSMGSSLSKNNYMIQLVMLTTLIRSNLIKKYKESNFLFTPPTKIKKEIACMVYGMNEKCECRNLNGVSGGKFNKHDMINAFIDYHKNFKLKEYILANKDKILNLKKISPPLPDVIDAFWIQEFLI